MNKPMEDYTGKWLKIQLEKTFEKLKWKDLGLRALIPPPKKIKAKQKNPHII